MRWLSQRGGMEAMAADHTHKGKGNGIEAANTDETSSNSVGPVSSSRGRFRGTGRGRPMCIKVLASGCVFKIK